MLRRIFFIITLCLVAGCTPALGNRGIGQDLYSSQTSLATNNIASYFGELCNQTHLQRSGTSAHCSDYSMLVQAGFNDIDVLFDKYMSLIYTKRAEAGRVHSSLVATTFWGGATPRGPWREACFPRWGLAAARQPGG